MRYARAWAGRSCEGARNGELRAGVPTLLVFLFFRGGLERGWDEQLAFLEVDLGACFDLHFSGLRRANAQHRLHPLPLPQALRRNILAVGKRDANVLAELAIGQIRTQETHG